MYRQLQRVSTDTRVVTDIRPVNRKHEALETHVLCWGVETHTFARLKRRSNRYKADAFMPLCAICFPLLNACTSNMSSNLGSHSAPLHQCV